jgi:hypothetical protein
VSPRTAQLVDFHDGRCALCDSPGGPESALPPANLDILDPHGTVTIRCTFCARCLNGESNTSFTIYRIIERVLAWYSGTPAYAPAVVAMAG